MGFFCCFGSFYIHPSKYLVSILLHYVKICLRCDKDQFRYFLLALTDLCNLETEFIFSASKYVLWLKAIEDAFFSGCMDIVSLFFLI